MSAAGNRYSQRIQAETQGCNQAEAPMESSRYIYRYGTRPGYKLYRKFSGVSGCEAKWVRIGRWMKAYFPERPLEDEARRASTLPTSVGSATESSLWDDNPDAGGLRSDIAARAFMSGVLSRGDERTRL
jgi:hypothetical protein